MNGTPSVWSGFLPSLITPDHEWRTWRGRVLFSQKGFSSKNFNLKDDFTKKYAGGKSATAVANSLNKEFGQYCVDHPEEVSKLAKVKAQVSEVKGVMMENIEKVLDRGEKIELPVDKTENLRSQVSKYT
ncbi:hypothetical protein ACOSP7_023552 [Xanthoceras sorbifolium]